MACDQGVFARETTEEDLKHKVEEFKRGGCALFGSFGLGMDADRDETPRLYRAILHADPPSTYFANAAREQLADLGTSLI